MFGVEETTFGDHREYVLRNPSTGEEARITSLGGNTRSIDLRAGEGDLIQILSSYRTPEELEAGEWSRGIKMIPFPNRIEDGRYRFGGEEHTLPINFPQQNHAIHGLISGEELSLLGTKQGDAFATVSLKLDLTGRHEGYPFALVVEINYTLSVRGFMVETLATNTGDVRLPFGDGWHPYYAFGDCQDVDSWRITIPARSRVEMNERLIPTGRFSPISGSDYDFLKARRIGSLDLDDVFTDVIETEGKTTTVLSSDELGMAMEIWQDRAYPYLVIFTPPGDERTCIAVEPMTCNTNAFNNGQGLIVLEPGESFRGTYGVRLVELGA
jgi:aldose 1-epimerase